MKTIKVADIYKTSDMRALVVPAEMPLADAIARFATDLELRGLFIVDETGRLAGVLSAQDILNWVRLELAMPPQTQAPAMAQVRRLVMAETVGHLAASGSAETAVSTHDSLADALDKMTRHNLTDIPVVDEAGRIINDLRLSEILVYVLQTGGDA